jgi:hypothetical protein
MSSTTHTSTEDRALKLLGAGVSPEQTAIALGVSPSRISQLVNDPEFSAKVAEKRFESHTKLNDIDERYEDIEIRLQEKLKDMLTWMTNPGQVLAAIRVINGTQRRGQKSVEAAQEQRQTVSLNMPTMILQNFTLNVNNQVIKAGDQELITVQSHKMKELLNESRKEPNHEQISHSG